MFKESGVLGGVRSGTNEWDGEMARVSWLEGGIGDEPGLGENRQLVTDELVEFEK